MSNVSEWKIRAKILLSELDILAYAEDVIVLCSD